MIKIVSKTLKSILSPSIISSIRQLKSVCIAKSIIYAHKIKNRNDVITSKKFDVISVKGEHCFFGYYDISPFDGHDHILNISVLDDGRPASINIYHVSTKANKEIVKTKVWNWQQGCRLRWLPGDSSKIIFNDIEKDHYCSRIVDVDNGKIIKTIDVPLYDIDKDGNYGITLNFGRLGYKRPGYGYTILQDDKTNLEYEGIDIVDMHNNKIERLVTYKDITDCLRDVKSLDNYYINHLSFSPSGNLFLFFFLDSSTSRHEAYMFVYNINKRKLVPIELHDKVSHYVWKNDNEIVATVYDNDMRCHYYKYYVSNQKRELYNNIPKDGHPSMINDKMIVTDTYPDKNCYQHLYIADDEGLRDDIASIFSNPLSVGEKRTDLHPRINKDKSMVCVDMNRYSKREMAVFFI